MAPLTAPLEGTKFQLNASGVAGFFGGEEAVSAMSTVHIYQGRKWLGWYNSPGSYDIAKRYGRLARARIWGALFPGVYVNPVVLFGMSGTKGPEFVATQSGTKISDTGHIGYIFLKSIQSLPTTILKNTHRNSTPLNVTIVHLGSESPDVEINVATPRKYDTLLAGVPILVSTGSCAACGVFGDWYCFSMILLGMLSSGISCFVIGSGTLKFTHPKPAAHCPPGDGYLQTPSDFVALRGHEGAVNSVTRGAFSLKLPGEPEYRAIGISAVVLMTQFLLQLLLIPQGTLFGQVMFLVSLAVSWAYNCYLSSFDRDKIQADLLLRNVLKYPVRKRYELGTRTAAVVFLLLALQPPNPDKVMSLLPDTATWKQWKKVVGDKVMRQEKLVFDESDYDGVANETERNLLKTLFNDASESYKGYLRASIDMEQGNTSGEVKFDELVV